MAIAIVAGVVGGLEFAVDAGDVLCGIVVGVLVVGVLGEGMFSDGSFHMGSCGGSGRERISHGRRGIGR